MKTSRGLDFISKTGAAQSVNNLPAGLIQTDGKGNLSASPLTLPWQVAQGGTGQTSVAPAPIKDDPRMVTSDLLFLHSDRQLVYDSGITLNNTTLNAANIQAFGSGVTFWVVVSGGVKWVMNANTNVYTNTAEFGGMSYAQPEWRTSRVTEGAYTSSMQLYMYAGTIAKVFWDDGAAQRARAAVHWQTGTYNTMYAMHTVSNYQPSDVLLQTIQTNTRVKIYKLI